MYEWMNECTNKCINELINGSIWVNQWSNQSFNLSIYLVIHVLFSLTKFVLLLLFVYNQHPNHDSTKFLKWTDLYNILSYCNWRYMHYVLLLNLRTSCTMYLWVQYKNGLYNKDVLVNKCAIDLLINRYIFVFVVSWPCHQWLKSSIICCRDIMECICLSILNTPYY